MTWQQLGNRGGKLSRKTRPINLEQLEARMMCTVSGLEESVLLLSEPLLGPAVGATVSSTNTAPTIATPINSKGSAVTSVDGKSIALAALATDDGRASLLKYNWQVTQSPTGSAAKFSKNNSNAAKATVLSFNKAGTYNLQLTITDAGGLSVTTSQSITVTPKVTRLELLSPGNSVLNAGRSIKTSAASAVVQALAYDQFGARMTTSPTFAWKSTAVPSGGAAAISGQANEASLTFNKAGSYSFESAAGGLTLRFTVVVSQTLSSVALTPGSVSLATGQSQQFTAVGRDQFQLPMSKQPKFAWTATGGTISTSGLFKAPSSNGSFTIAATTGALRGEAVATVAASAPANGLQNAVLSNLVQTYFADGSITRPEMMQLLRAAGNDGAVNSEELSDLRYVVSNASVFNIANYVQVLASNVVNTNLANNLYQGLAAGNLAAGSTATQLNNLVDKWFQGTDRPVLTSGSLSYRAASGSLFVGAPTYANEKQGTLGDCYFIAALGSMGSTNPDSVRNMFVNNGDGTYTVRFFGGSYGAYYNADGTISDGFSNGVGVADYVTVDLMLPATSSGTFAYSNYGASLTNSGNVLWIALAEKAYAQWNATGKSGRTSANSYASIEGGWMSNVNSQVLGYNSTRYSSSNASNKQALVNALNAGNAVTVGTLSNSTALVSSHAYSITAYNATTDQFTLFNPWGTSHPAPLTWAQIQANTSAFVVANALNSTPIASSALGGIASVRSQVSQALSGFATPLHISSPANAFAQTAVSSELALEQLPVEYESAMVDIEAQAASADEGIESAYASEEQLAVGHAREAVDLLFDIDRIDELLSELLA